jgi:hypothetical protein
MVFGGKSVIICYSGIIYPLITNVEKSWKNNGRMERLK